MVKEYIQKFTIFLLPYLVVWEDNFNNNQTFSLDRDWDNCFIRVPYENYILDEKIDTVSPNSKHFGKDGHSVWNRFLINYIISHKFI